MKELEKLPKFIHHCMTIGEIPTSYKVSLTYEEQLMWFCKFLQDQVIPVVNNNSEAVQELQTYVANYFENLDVQEEINNKLEEMADDGTLEEIITEYINLKSILAYNTKAEMKVATNLVDGSFTKTYGTTTYNDGYGEFYKIRTLLNTDVIDENNIVALTNFPTLIAEKIPNNHLTDLKDDLTEDIIKNNKLENKRFVMIGDSYVTGTLNGQMYATDGWAKRIKDKLGLSNNNCFIYGDGGAGFTGAGHQGYTFITLLENNLSNITDKDTIDYVIVCGGLNDAESTITTVEEAIEDFSDIVKSNFPNAKMFVGMIETTSQINATATLLRRKLSQISLPAYQNCIKYGAYYLNGVESILKDYSLMGTDFIHPSIDGYNALRDGILQALETGNFTKTTGLESITVTALDTAIQTNNLLFAEKITNDILTLTFFGDIRFSSYIYMNTGVPVKLFHLNSKFIRKNYSNDKYLKGTLTVGTGELTFDFFAYIDDDNDLCVRFLTYPDGLTGAPFFTFRFENDFNINN